MEPEQQDKTCALRAARKAAVRRSLAYLKRLAEPSLVGMTVGIAVMAMSLLSRTVALGRSLFCGGMFVLIVALAFGILAAAIWIIATAVNVAVPGVGEEEHKAEDEA